LPIIYALSYPGRKSSTIKRLDFETMSSLTFRKPDMEKFRNLALAFEALEIGGNAPCVLNASNEIAVEAFLSGRIGFLAIPEIVEQSLAKVSYIKDPGFDDYVYTDSEARKTAGEAVKELE
jgi:1-deoxy-D-xylulose-5-phosphate reductoisomerase